MRAKISVTGIVQGVGFRPFVYSAAVRRGLSGHVLNTGAGVDIEAQGTEDDIKLFMNDIRVKAPPLAFVESLKFVEIDEKLGSGFSIMQSELGSKTALVSPDIAVCEDCLHELSDPSDRRYTYPFINCTNCGPRYTIIKDIPYDRPNTTMDVFPMCEHCANEYSDQSDRRYHAQPVACPYCGPSMMLVDSSGQIIASDGGAIRAAAAAILDGAIVAVKGIGGYHLTCLASDEIAVAKLRSRKYREDKPFAVMAGSIEDVRALCELSDEEEVTLSGARKPILLCVKKQCANIAGQVAPGNRYLGVMLPYTPLHSLLLDAVRAPVVMTSGNRSDEPIAFRDESVRELLHGIPDAYLIHDRQIHVRCDDSVARVWRGRERLIRRSRGYAPAPLLLDVEAHAPILACGAELKNTFCILRGSHAFMSHHIGDLDNVETLQSYEEGILHFERLFDVKPDAVAFDMHPEYLPTKYAQEYKRGVRHVAVQHHHAHLASCLADACVKGPAIGVIMDGLGYGLDGTMWGGEWLVGDARGFIRAGRLKPLPMQGGAACIKNPWRMAAGALYTLGVDEFELFQRISGGALDPASWEVLRTAIDKGINSPHTTSMGRLFDIVSVLTTGRREINYEGQAAVELERIAKDGQYESYEFDVSRNGRTEYWGEIATEVAVHDCLQVDFSKTIMAVAGAMNEGADAGEVSARFHATVARAIHEVCLKISAGCGLKTIALSGGVFQNILLLDAVVGLLENDGFNVVTHARVPCNDGGISLGQAVIAAAALKRNT